MGSAECPYRCTRGSGLVPSVWMVVDFPQTSNWLARYMTTATARASDTEKITINLGLIDLGQIDLLVQEGFYSNRTDFIRTAIRNHLATHAEAVRQAVVRKTLVLGLVEFTRADLEGVKKSGKQLRIQVLGLARIAPDVSAALALATIESVSVLGAFHASPAVKAALADRIH
jgi:Arc/MetJ-type ribon-helix-helix transcriptional regulator